MARPIQPSVRRALAETLALNDPRCAHDHKPMVDAAGPGFVCPGCHCDLVTYISIGPVEWPEP